MDQEIFRLKRKVGVTEDLAREVAQYIRGNSIGTKGVENALVKFLCFDELEVLEKDPAYQLEKENRRLEIKVGMLEGQLLTLQNTGNAESPAAVESIAQLPAFSLPANRCPLCGKEKGQPPERCPGHYAETAEPATCGKLNNIGQPCILPKHDAGPCVAAEDEDSALIMKGIHAAPQSNAEPAQTES